MRWIVLAFCAVMLASTSAFCAQGVSPEEKEKQTAFRKAYATPDPAERAKALEQLEGATHPSTSELLSVVARTDPAKETRLAAYKVLSKMPARDAGLSQLLTALFQNIKFSETETRLDFAEQMGNSEFKYAICEALADYGGKLRYPELWTGNRPGNNANPGLGGGAVGGDPNQGIRKQRAEFEKFVKVFQKVTGTSIAAVDKDSPQAIRTWWNENRAKVATEDRALADKFKAEDTAELNKNNPLLPKSAKKAE